MKKGILIPLCIVGSIAMLAGGFFGMMGIQRHLDKKSYEKTDIKIEAVIEDSDYESMNIDERKEKIDSLLYDLQENGEISDIWFDEITKNYRFTFKSGVLGGIALRDHDDQTFAGGYAYDSEKDASSPVITNTAKTSLMPVAKTDAATKANANIEVDSKEKEGLKGPAFGGKLKVQLCYSLQEIYKPYFDNVDKEWPTDMSKYYKDYDFSVEKLKNLKNRDVYILAFHGSDILEQKTIVVDADGGIFKYWKDLLRHDIAKIYGDGGNKGKGSYLVLPSFFEHNYSKNALKGSVMVVESCMFYGCDCDGDDIDTTYADVFVNYLGVDAVLGFRNSVNAAYATDITGCVIDEMLVDDSSIETALSSATEKYGADDDWEDVAKDKYKAFPVLTGDKEKKFTKKNALASSDNSSEKSTKTSSDKNTEAATNATTEKTTEVTEKATTEKGAENTSKPDEKKDSGPGKDASSGDDAYSGIDYAEEVYGDVLYVHAIKKDECRSNGGDLGNLDMNDYPYSKETDGRYSRYIIDKEFKDMGYKIEDIDGDGVYELILADLNSSMIYEVFTLKDGTPTMMLDSWERNRIDYCGDYLLGSGSSGAANQMIIKYKLDGGIARAELMETSMRDNSYDNTNSMYYGYMNYEEGYNDESEITEKAYLEMLDEWNSHKCIVPDLKNVEDYLADRAAKEQQTNTAEQIDITENEWKSAYTERINSVLQEYGHAYGYVYDLDGNGIPELIISDFGKHTGESYTYTEDGMIALGNLAGEFSHIYFQDGYFISMSSSGGLPGAIWVDVKKLDVNVISTINELEFGYKLAGDGKPEVKGAGSYDEAVSIIESYGMSAGFTEINYDGETYCQVDVDMSSLEQMNVYEDEDFVTAVENY